MHTKPAGMAQCVTCQYWSGERKREAADQVSFANPYATAACQNPASTLYRGQVQPIAVCNHWNRWQQP